MTTMDIRTIEDENVEYISFANARNEDGDYIASRIDLGAYNGDTLYIDEGNGDGDTLRLSIRDVPNFIKALNKAVELKQARS